MDIPGNTYYSDINSILLVLLRSIYLNLETQLKQEKERGARKIQVVRLTCQNLVLHMAKTVKEYLKKTMEDMRREHKKELERARKEGIQEGMRRQRHLLQRNMVQ